MLRFGNSEYPAYAEMMNYVSNKQPDGSYFVICCADYGKRMWLQRINLAKNSRTSINKVCRWWDVPVEERSERSAAIAFAAWFSWGSNRKPKPLAYIELKESTDKGFAKFKKAAQKFAK